MSKAYKDAGVDIDAGNALVEAIKPLASATERPGMAGGLGGFGALFDLQAAGYTDPILVAATDGVGTKLDIAKATGRHDTIGIDLVAMCVNDLVVQGAEPLFFLDYLATGKLETGAATAVVAGIAAGCAEARCGLIGGETAEMPGLYPPGAYDLAGFAVGAAERGTLIDGSGVEAGDIVLALGSSGLHSNGFSLVRKVVADRALELDAASAFEPDKSLGEALLTPTRIYVRACLAAVRAGGVKAMAHITGGGLIENIPRVLPDGLGARLEGGAWEVPPVFRWIAEAGAVDAADMARTFNCGVGMAVVVAPENAETLASVMAGAGETVRAIGHVVPADSEPRVAIEGWDGQWQ